MQKLDNSKVSRVPLTYSHRKPAQAVLQDSQKSWSKLSNWKSHAGRISHVKKEVVSTKASSTVALPKAAQAYLSELANNVNIRQLKT